MNANENGPDAQQSGYTLVNLYALERTLKPVSAEDEGLPEEEPNLSIIWDWRIPQIESVVEAIPKPAVLTALVFEIALGVELAPSQERPEVIRTLLIGRFRLEAGEQSVPLVQFVKLHGVASLYPYLREAVSDLTDLSIYGDMHLPILNVSVVMDDFDLESSTGWDQLSQNPKLAEALEFDIPGLVEEPAPTAERPNG